MWGVTGGVSGSRRTKAVRNNSKCLHVWKRSNEVAEAGDYRGTFTSHRSGRLRSPGPRTTEEKLPGSHCPPTEINRIGVFRERISGPGDMVGPIWTY